jgi:hypothetical protein
VDVLLFWCRAREKKPETFHRWKVSLKTKQEHQNLKILPQQLSPSLRWTDSTTPYPNSKLLSRPMLAEPNEDPIPPARGYAQVTVELPAAPLDVEK